MKNEREIIARAIGAIRKKALLSNELRANLSPRGDACARRGAPGAGTADLALAYRANAPSAAAIVSAMSDAVCAADTNPASYADGAR